MNNHEKEVGAAHLLCVKSLQKVEAGLTALESLQAARTIMEETMPWLNASDFHELELRVLSVQKQFDLDLAECHKAISTRDEIVAIYLHQEQTN